MSFFSTRRNSSKSKQAERAFAANDKIIDTEEGRELLRYRALSNQDSIVAMGRRQPAIKLVPAAPRGCGGNIEHYFHFLFDLVLPLSLLCARDTKTTYVVNSFGPFTEILQSVFGKRVQIDGDTQASHELVGMNPRCSQVESQDLAILKRHSFQALGMNAPNRGKKILLIERVPPADYYLTEATVKGGGSARRSIKNHSEVHDAIAERINPAYSLLNVHLEKLSFSEQLALFGEAALVIAQHGAGLGNCIWMHAETPVVEIGSVELDHFKNLANANGQPYCRFPVSDSHVTVPVSAFSDWLTAQPALAPFFR